MFELGSQARSGALNLAIVGPTRVHNSYASPQTRSITPLSAAIALDLATGDGRLAATMVVMKSPNIVAWNFNDITSNRYSLIQAFKAVG